MAGDPLWSGSLQAFGHYGQGMEGRDRNKAGARCRGGRQEGPLLVSEGGLMPLRLRLSGWPQDAACWTLGIAHSLSLIVHGQQLQLAGGWTQATDFNPQGPAPTWQPAQDPTQRGCPAGLLPQVYIPVTAGSSGARTILS